MRHSLHVQITSARVAGGWLSVGFIMFATSARSGQILLDCGILLSPEKQVMLVSFSLENVYTK
jgi:hypothetical protein